MGFPLLTRMHPREKGKVFLRAEVGAKIAACGPVRSDCPLLGVVATRDACFILLWKGSGQGFRQLKKMNAKRKTAKDCFAMMRTEKSPLPGCR